jgi:hypothetical protein
MKVALIVCLTAGQAASKLHPELLYHSLSRLTVFDENYKYGNLIQHLLLKVNSKILRGIFDACLFNYSLQNNFLCPTSCVPASYVSLLAR